MFIIKTNLLLDVRCGVTMSRVFPIRLVGLLCLRGIRAGGRYVGVRIIGPKES